jgi:hypothetical protein
LSVLLAAITSSPIVYWRRAGAPDARLGDWTAVRKSDDVDAYVLAWIASHVRDPQPSRRNLM